MKNKVLSGYIVNKNALKRIGFIYIPVFLAMWLSLFVVGYYTGKQITFLKLDQDFKDRIPLVYHDGYNIEFFGIEEFHPFDSTKYRRVFQSLNVMKGKTINAGIPTFEILKIAHAEDYLDSLNKSWELARITELGFLRFFPNNLSRKTVLNPMLYQTGGSLLAGLAALEHGWAINLGGGFHHASRNKGEGFCAFADISLVINYLRKNKKVKRAMVIDLDAHQGNGHGRDFINDDSVYIFDIYNNEIFPQDEDAKKGIDLKIEIPAFTSDIMFLEKLQHSLEKAFTQFTPDIIIYVAGTDILEGDPLGVLRISELGVIKRDEMVFQAAFENKIPIVMLLGGGYQKSNAPVIADSIVNLRNKFTLW